MARLKIEAMKRKSFEFSSTFAICFASMKNSPSGYSQSMVYLAAAINAAGLVILCVSLAFVRNVDGDEGLYLEAARLVIEGKRLYFDFFYQQMPLIPYFYAAWAKLFGFSLESARVFSALLSAGGGIWAIFYLAKVSKNIFIVNVSALLLYANGVFLAWAPVVKTHPFNTLFLTGFCLLLLWWRREGCRGFLKPFFSGLMLGFGIGCRLTLAPFALVSLLYVLQTASHRWKACGVFCLGMLLGSLPVIYYFALDPALFLNYNLLYHTRIFPGIASDDFRMSVAAKVLLEPQFLFLLVLLYAGLIFRGFKGWRDLLLSDQFFVCVVLFFYFAIHLSAATPFTQYFATVVPLLVVAALPMLELALRWNTAIRALVLLPLLFSYVGFASQLMRYELYSVGSLNPEWRLRNVRAAAIAVRRIAKPGEPCLTWWPGYAVLGNCASVPGMENHMREHAILRGIGRSKLEEYQFRPGEAVIEDLKDARYRVVIDGAYRLQTPYNDYAEYLLQENYVLRTQRGMAKIYTRKQSGDELGAMFLERIDGSLMEETPSPVSRRGRSL